MVGGRHGQLLDAWGMSADHPDPLVAPVALPSRSIPWSVLCVDRHLHTAHHAGAYGAKPASRSSAGAAFYEVTTTTGCLT